MVSRAGEGQAFGALRSRDLGDRILVSRCASVAEPGWLELRQALWPQDPKQQLAEMAAQLAAPQRFVAFVARRDGPVGFAEAALRSDYVNGTHSSPVAFLEGIYVCAHARRQGIARELVTAVSRWARDAGCSELASDALLDNEISHSVHRALGFEETERVVFFRKQLA